MSQQEPLTPFGSALAGALGAIFSNALVYPLDTAKTRIQALPHDEVEREVAEATEVSPSLKEKAKGGNPVARLVVLLANKTKKMAMLAMLIRILRTEGLAGTFRGFAASMINTFSMQFAYFYFHSFLRTAALKKTPSLGTGAELGLGAAAGALAQIFTIPVAVVATRQQLWNPPKGASGKAAKEPSLLQTARSIIAEGGVTALWTGLKPGLVLTVNPAITYGVFERGKGMLLKGRANQKLGVAEAFWLGCLSKTLATVVTYPYIFAKVRLQGHTPDDVDGHVPKGAIELLKDVYHEQGIKGWYQGLSAQIIKAVLCQGILFVSKEQFEVQARQILSFAGDVRAKVAANGVELAQRGAALAAEKGAQIAADIKANA